VEWKGEVSEKPLLRYRTGAAAFENKLTKSMRGGSFSKKVATVVKSIDFCLYPCLPPILALSLNGLRFPLSLPPSIYSIYFSSSFVSPSFFERKSAAPSGAPLALQSIPQIENATAAATAAATADALTKLEISTDDQRGTLVKNATVDAMSNNPFIKVKQQAAFKGLARVENATTNPLN